MLVAVARRPRIATAREELDRRYAAGALTRDEYLRWRADPER
ncbi:MAG: SHOCT domain-containing protein [Egibacteraceae bacterium]